MKSDTRKYLSGYMFISPWLVGFVLFLIGPFIASIYLSFTKYDGKGLPVWIGAANYHQLLARDPIFWKALFITLKLSLIHI